jgi:hypothetical protein
MTVMEDKNEQRFQKLEEGMETIKEALLKLTQRKRSRSRSRSPTPEVRKRGRGGSQSPPSDERKRERDDDSMILDDDEDVGDLTRRLLESDNVTHEPGDVLEEFEGLLKPEEKTGPPVEEKLGKVGTTMFTNPLPREKAKTVREKYPIAANMNNVLVPRINEPFWGEMTANQRKTDIKIAAGQSLVITAASAIFSAVDKLRKDGDRSGVVEQLLDATALLGRSHYDSSVLRRLLIKPVLGDYTELCSEKVPFTERLFGDDLPQAMKEIKQTKEVDKELTRKSGFSQKYKPSPRDHKESKNWNWARHEKSRGGRHQYQRGSSNRSRGNWKGQTGARDVNFHKKQQ